MVKVNISGKLIFSQAVHSEKKKTFEKINKIITVVYGVHSFSE